MVAIVGPNGAGKSTLLKLLCRFYDPETGTIEIDGIDVRELRIHDLRRLITVLFQQPVHYNDTVADNICFGDFDEPTSAMDPWAETDWLDRFRSLSEGRTSILITHRLTTAMRADVIHVMAEGQIVESGSHEKLLARGGLYAQSWAAQVGYQPA